jgi:flagellar L-ring protein precursor FlgH
MTLRLALPLLVAGVHVAACGTSHIEYKPKTRKYDPGAYAAAVHPSGASLFVDGSRGLFEDDRAGRIGDVVIIKIDENDAGSHAATSKLARAGSNDMGVPGSFGLLTALAKSNPDLDPSHLFQTSTAQNFDGQGAVTRSGKLSGTLPVRVRAVTPNGDLYVEGTKVVLVGAEENHLYISGVIRMADIKPDNTVLSSQVADAEIEFTGTGDASDQQRPGWMSRLLSSLWPF